MEYTFIKEEKNLDSIIPNNMYLLSKNPDNNDCEFYAHLCHKFQEEDNEIFKINNEKELHSENSMESNNKINPNNINASLDENKCLNDKNYKENIQLKIRQKIYLKRPFKERKILGRKKKISNGMGEHNKFSDDNIIRKCKCAILNNTLEFINKKIKILYPNITKKSFREKKLFKLKQNQRASSRADYNKSFLSKSLKSIFSEDISTKFINYPPTHNKDAIELLINEKDEKKRNIFNNIFNLTFSDCLNHFRGTNVIDELKGLNQLNNYINEIKEDNMAEEYCNLFKFFIYNFERIINEKKPRKRV
jgi:hypothetical protein